MYKCVSVKTYLRVHCSYALYFDIYDQHVMSRHGFGVKGHTETRSSVSHSVAHGKASRRHHPHSGGACPRSVPHTRSKQREEAMENEKDRIDVDMSWMSLARALFLSFSFFPCALSLRSFSALLRTPHPPLCARVLKGCKDRVPYFVGGDAFSRLRECRG